MSQFGQARRKESTFLLPWQVERMPSAMDVDGPDNVNRIPVNHDETVQHFPCS